MSKYSDELERKDSSDHKNLTGVMRGFQNPRGNDDCEEKDYFCEFSVEDTSANF